MTGDSLPDADHVSRYCSPGRIEDGLPAAAAFELRPQDQYLSVNWLVLQPLRDDRYRPLLVIPAKAGIHRFKPDCYCQNNMDMVLEYWRLSDLGMALDRIRGEFDLRVSESGRFAVLNVSEVKAAVEKVTQRRSSITHQPTDTMKSHAGVFGFFASDFEVAAELAEIVAAENVFPAVSGNGQP